MDKFRKSDYLIILSAVYCAITIAMNAFAVKPLSFGAPIIIMDAGTLISWIPFAISNILLEAYDRKTAEKITIYTAFISLSVFILGFIITFIPTLPEYNEQRLHFSYIYNNGPRVIIASFIAFIVGLIINIRIIDKLKKKAKKRDTKSKFFYRAFISSVIGQFMDNLIFQVLAFAPLDLTWYEMAFKDIMTAVICTTIIEIILESIFILPLTNSLTQKIKHAE